MDGGGSAPLGTTSLTSQSFGTTMLRLLMSFKPSPPMQNRLPYSFSEITGILEAASSVSFATDAASETAWMIRLLRTASSFILQLSTSESEPSSLRARALLGEVCASLRSTKEFKAP